ncbi:MAG: glycosyltransferase family 4 protein [Minisyncoccia bacterium]
MGKNVLIITDSYPPEIRSAAQLMEDLAQFLQQKGHRVWVATSYPRYNLDKETINKIWPEISEEQGIKILRIKTLPHHKVNFIVRGIAQLFMPYIFLYKIKNHIKDKIDTVIVHSPPLPLSITAYQVKKIYGAKYILNLHDFFPQNAIDLGILKNKLLIKFFERMAKNAYQRADLIVVPSHEHKKYLLERKEVNDNKIEVVYHWLNAKIFIQAKKTGKFRKLYGLENKFIFVFGGVLGPSQGLEYLIKIAEKVRDFKDIVFLFVGDGTEKSKLEKMVNDYNLENVIFKPFVSYEEYPELLKDCDVGVISLTTKNTTPAVPAKISTYLAAGLPIIAFLNKKSEALLIINQSQCGYGIISEDEEKGKELVLKMYHEKDKLKELGDNGFKYFVNNLSSDVCLNKFEQLI